MNRPDVEKILAPLKPFQRRTVDHAFHRLFEAEDSTARFLVADEVGLGKTLVARGVIAKTIDRLWDDVKRIDVLYICSNGSIARANLPKLTVGVEGERSFSLATRLTMLATQLSPRDGERGIADSKLNFISFTPSTSFQLGNSAGRGEEREVLFHLLLPLIGNWTPLSNLLQGGISRTDDWRWRLQNPAFAIDASIRSEFAAKFAADPALEIEIRSLCDAWFFRIREAWPEDARVPRNALIGKLRKLLAEVCVGALQPDLVILDEFQRFKPLLETRPDKRDPAAELAQSLFDFTTPEGQPVRTLLLSATPYKLFTKDAEIADEEHFADFLATTRFLFKHDTARVDALQQDLAAFGGALKRVATGGKADVLGAKVKVEAALRTVMARTERVSSSEDRDAMVEAPESVLELLREDVDQYMAADAIFRAVGENDPMAYWKSAPYLAHFMHGYKFHERLTEALANSRGNVTKVVRARPLAFLQHASLSRWNPVPLANAKLRDVARDLLDGGLWQLLWIPPTVEYWPLAGAFAGHRGQTKTLLFSAWNVVPDAISAVLSYEAERRMMGGQLASYSGRSRQQPTLLRLTQGGAGTLARHRLFLLLMPCLTLADEAHPLAAPKGVDRRTWVRARVVELLAACTTPEQQAQEVDDRWEWYAPLALDPGLGPFLESVRAATDVPNPDAFVSHVDDFLSLDRTNLGRMPDGLADLLTDVALGSPAVLAARMMLASPVSEPVRRCLALKLAHGFWKLFNRPDVIKLLHQLTPRSSVASREEAHYWRLVLRYCIDGNLQAVLDEAWHQGAEQVAWSAGEDPDAAAEKCLQALAKVVEPPVARVHAQCLDLPNDREGDVQEQTVRVRTSFALRFGDVRTDQQQFSQDDLRAAFNSPFRPFVLASTSIGQEGLDFHPWCHRLVHWNLPGNPVDLEQREGRVHRYKGHAVRRNVAHEHEKEALDLWRPGTDLWAALFGLADAAARAEGKSDLIPFWVAPGPFKVQRRVPALPYTREVEELRSLKRQLAAYRVAFGQPRQEELVTLLGRSTLGSEELARWAIDLAP